MSVLYCKKMLGDVRGAALVELVERSTGETCPCKQGRPCPLVPAVRISPEGADD